MLYMMDQVRIEASDTERFLSAFERVFLPAAALRGMELVACWHTPADIGEDVTVASIFRVRDFAHWAELRRAAVLDPAMTDWVRELFAMRKSGTRHFYTPAACSPLR